MATEIIRSLGNSLVRLWFKREVGSFSHKLTYDRALKPVESPPAGDSKERRFKTLFRPGSSIHVSYSRWLYDMITMEEERLITLTCHHLLVKVFYTEERLHALGVLLPDQVQEAFCSSGLVSTNSWEVLGLLNVPLSSPAVWSIVNANLTCAALRN